MVLADIRPDVRWSLFWSLFCRPEIQDHNQSLVVNSVRSSLAHSVPQLIDLQKNMKYILLSITTLLFSLSCLASEKMEMDFLERLEAFVSQGDFSKEKLNEVWLVQDTPSELFAQTLDGLKELKKQGIGESRFHEIYPAMREGMSQPIEIEGKTYALNLTPYKMVEIKYSAEIPAENGSITGWSYVLGESDGHLYMMGLKEQIKAE